MLDNTTSQEAIFTMALTACLFFVYGAVVVAFRYRRMSTWVALAGQPLAAPARVPRGARRAASFYTYTVEGKTYAGQRFCATDAFPLYRESIGAVRSNLRQGSTIAVYVRPGKPNESSLACRVEGHVIPKFWASAVVMLCSALWAMRTLDAIWPLVAAAAVLAGCAMVTETVRYRSLRSREI